MDILYRQTVIYQQCIYWDLRRIVCFQRRYIFKNRLARFARTQSCIHFLQFPTRRHSIRPYIMNINEHIKWTNTRTYCTDKNMLLTNLTIARFQRKIRKFRLARSQSVTYVFRYVLYKKKRGGSHTINYYGKSGDSRTPDPRQGLYTRNCNGRNYTSYHSWRPSWRPLFAENSRASGGSAPWAPGRGYGGPLDPTRMRRALRAHTVRYAHGFFRPPLFLQILDPPLYTSPLARPSRLPPEASILGELGSSRPPPPMNFFFWGGQTYRFAPPPPIISSTWKIEIICNARIG